MNKAKTLTISAIALISLVTIPASFASSAYAQNNNPNQKTYNVILPRGEDSCGASLFLKQLQADKGFLKRAMEMSKTNPKLRIITGNQAMTRDFRRERLTVIIDSEKATISLNCN